MWSRHMNLPFRNVLPAFAPYRDPIAFDSATELRSSVFAAAGKVFEPVTPALVAFIASTACSPSRLSRVTRRSAAVGACFDEWCIACPSPPPAIANAEKTSAPAAASVARNVSRDFIRQTPQWLGKKLDEGDSSESADRFGALPRRPRAPPRASAAPRA